MTYTCSYCPNKVERNKNGLKLISCFECRRERVRLRQEENRKKNKEGCFCHCGNKLYGKKSYCSETCAGTNNKLLK